MRRVLYPGSFDPIHLGHVEIIETASHLFDDIVVAATVNPQKGTPKTGGGLFDLDERVEIITEVCAHLDNVTVTQFSGLVVDLARQVNADFILKGLRAVSDYETELQMAQMNHALSGIHTVFIPSASTRSFLASKLIREVTQLGGDVSTMVPEPVQRRLKSSLS